MTLDTNSPIRFCSDDERTAALVGMFGPCSNPPVSAYRADPLSDVEIDAMPDGARVWATILAIREEAQAQRQAESDAEYEDWQKEKEEACDSAEQEGRDAACHEFRRTISDLEPLEGMTVSEDDWRTILELFAEIAEEVRQN